ncbi:hypothetical protein E1N52_40605 [Paraburkholderia guartelaensis]|uniref:Uncharacterized protein n=1 Tax=Paraburkholderia guartelaensis TaxID=2546446 RepID=A0A4R5L199_9BURK|nr:hypothetical protein [Paraburkholderia guartelaensis]TDG02257.1 hypothetical protein E1N52_40605 [Paraburkholderia guartelaensis]
MSARTNNELTDFRYGSTDLRDAADRAALWLCRTVSALFATIPLPQRLLDRLPAGISSSVDQFLRVAPHWSFTLRRNALASCASRYERGY